MLDTNEEGALAIEVWTWPTPNGHKVHIALEELGLPYAVVPVASARASSSGPNSSPSRRTIASPRSSIPRGRAASADHAVRIRRDPDLPRGEGRRAHPGAIPAARYACLQWLMFQMGGVGPMFGQYGHFNNYAPEKLPYAMERYAKEVQRLHRVLEKRLSEAEYLAGADYSIADIATFPWLRFPERRNIDLAEYPSVKRWHDAIAARPAVQRGGRGAGGPPAQGTITDAERENLFGARQFQAR